MDDRARGWLPDRAREAQSWAQDRAQQAHGWAQERAQSLPWAQGVQQPFPPGAAGAPAMPPTVPNPVMNPMAAPAMHATGTPEWGGQPERPNRRWPKRVLIGAGVVALFALGSCAGGIGQMHEVSTLRTELETTTGQLTGMSAERDELSLLVEQQGDDLLAAQEESETLATTLGTTETDLATAQTDLTTAQTDLAASQALVSERDATIASLQAELAAAQAAAAPAIAPLVSAPSQPAAAAPAAPAASAYYANCTAVRAAGAAPIRAGQPGYGGHLDRDGDGVGCE
ncbi:MULTISPECIES: excalibur calcium-binding domain-containing protein [unclassified Agrococcus]|uniref:excalibur calcium-binding domain-containing protein n=1 Tax=unclassified Agrococcus TaxID=2615065 RepID=UPI0036084F77